MSFGKRGNGSRGQPSSPSRQPDPVRANQPQAQDTESQWLQPAMLLGAASVAIIAVLALTFMMLPGRKTQPVIAGEPAPIVTSDVAPLATIRQRMTTGEAGRTFEFAIKSSASARCFDQINSARPWRHPGWTNRALDEENGILKFEYEVAGEALNCLFTEKQERFCQAPERVKMTNAVASYLKKYRRDVTRARRAVGAPETAQGKMFKDLAERMKASDPAGGDGDDEAADDTKRFFAGIESATSAGYFTAAEFGGKSVPELAPYMVTAVSKPCR